MKFIKSFTLVLFLLSSNLSHAQWKPIGDVFGGEIYGLQQNSTYHFAQGNSNIYRSKDLYEWFALSKTEMEKIPGFYTDFTDWIYASNNLLFISDHNRTIYSTDNGSTFQEMNPPDLIYPELGVSILGSKIYALTYREVNDSTTMLYAFESSNLGADWTLLDSILVDGDYIYETKFNHGGRFVVRMEQKLIKFNAGVFTDITPVLTMNENLSSAAISSNGTVAAIVGNEQLFTTTIKYHNGVIWSNATGIEGSHLSFSLSSSGTSFYASSVNITDFTFYLYASDNGTSYNKLDISGKKDLFVNDVLKKSSTQIVLSSFRGVYNSTNSGATISNVSRGMREYYVSSMVTTNSGVFAALSGLGLYRSLNGGNNFTYISPTTSFDPMVFESNGKLLLIEYGFTLEMFTSTDNGNSWNKVNAPAGVDFEDWDIYVEILNAGNNNIMISVEEYNSSTFEYEERYFAYSISAGTWKEITDNLPGDMAYLDDFFDINNVMYAIIEDTLNYDSRVYKSSNGGTTWTIESSIPVAQNYYTMAGSKTQFFVRDGLFGDLYAYNGSTFELHDNVSESFTLRKCFDLGATTYMPTYGELYFTMDTGATWEMIAQDYLNEIDISAGCAFNNRLIVGTDGAGMFVRDWLASTPELSLSLKVYPNPASDKIHVQLPTSTIGTMELMDMKGSVISKKLLVGSSDFELSVKDLEKGIYLLNYRTADKNYHSKLVVN